MMNEIVLVGFGGHAKSVADVIERQKRYKIVGYTDVEERTSEYKYLGNDDSLASIYNSGVKNAVIALGYLGVGELREKLFSRLKEIGFNLPVIIDPSAIVSDSADIDEGTFIGKGVIINCEVCIGKCCIINTGAIIEHETIVGDFSHISVGTVLCGQTRIGHASFIGANSTVIQTMEIADREVVPAGTVMRKNKTVFGSVVYNASIEFLDEFIDSINAQSNYEFDILLINDDIRDKNIINRIKKRLKFRRVIIKDYSDCDYSPALLRVELLKQARTLGYRLAILGDCDDTFSSNRVDCVVKEYHRNKDVTFFYNDLIINNNSVFDTLPDRIDDITDLMQYNFIGMSTSAVNLETISDEFIDSLCEFDGFVFDWFLFSRMLTEKKTGILIHNASTIYRIHENSFAGINNKSRTTIQKELDVKKKHYQIMKKYDSRYDDLLSKINNINIDDFSTSVVTKYWWSNIIF